MSCQPSWLGAFRVVLFAGLALSPWPAIAAAAQEVPRFRDPEYRVNEDAGTAEITVVRNDTSDQSYIRYETADGTALASKDYQPVSGTLAFAAGEGAKTFRVPIIEDTAAEDDETVQLKLRSAGREDALTGGVVTEGSTATLIISSNDRAPGAPDPAAAPGTAPPDAAAPGTPPASEATTVRDDPAAAGDEPDDGTGPDNPEAAAPAGAESSGAADDDDTPLWVLLPAVALLLGAIVGAAAWKLRNGGGNAG